MMAYMYQTKNLYKQLNVLHLVALIIVFFERQRIKLSPLQPIRFLLDCRCQKKASLVWNAADIPISVQKRVKNSPCCVKRHI